MAMLDHDVYPALVWMWKWGQFDEEDRRSFIALVQRYEDTKSVDPRAALDLLESIVTAAGGVRTGFVGWYRSERAALGFPVSWQPLGSVSPGPVSRFPPKPPFRNPNRR